MAVLKPAQFELGTGLLLLATAAAGIVWWVRRRRPTPDEIERARRALLAHSGRMVDGMLLNVCEIEAEDGRTLTMLVFNYCIGGVDYECSQDITAMRDIVDPASVRAGFPCTIRYLQRNPQNSIVIAEEWSGLRSNLPELPRLGGRKPANAPSAGAQPS